MRTAWRVLGEFEAQVGGRLLVLGPARQRCVLAALLMDAARPVAVERLAERVWGDAPPPGIHSTLYGYLSRLRQALHADDHARIVRQSGGYVLQLDRSDVDLFQFRDQVAQARASHDDQVADKLFDQALRLWRGEAFASLDSPWLRGVRDDLSRERLAAEVDHADVLLRLGRHAEVLEDTAARAAMRPLDERVLGQLMLALHRAGRTAEALAHYSALRLTLADELGIEPGGALQELYLQMLNQPGRPLSVPRQLPMPPRSFTGRAAELRQLGDPAGPDTPGAGRIWAIDGAGGMGKTWLALHWAHAHAESFPDGQLYVDLRGFASSTTVMDPAEAIRSFLDALGAGPDRIPAGFDAQLSLYRSMTSGKRMLVVLDNARDVAQVRLLLPGSLDCVVLVTSRNQLTGLITTEDAVPLTLDLLTVEEARDLLRIRLGSERVAAEPQAVDDLISRCGRLPLALAIVAAQAIIHADVPLADLFASLRKVGTGLDGFIADDFGTDLRTVFSWSYRALDPDTARMFRLLGLVPGPDISAAAAASLAGQPPRQAKALLKRLARAHLLTRGGDGRYALHDLLRVYATEQAGAEEPEGQRLAAQRRLADHYLHTVHRTAMLLQPHRHPITLAAPAPDVVAEDFADRVAGLNWFWAEHRNLVTVSELTTRLGLDTHTWQLAWSMQEFLNRGRHFVDMHAVFTRGLDAAVRQGDLAAKAHTHRGLGIVSVETGDIDDAQRHYETALHLYGELGDHAAQATTSTNLASAAATRGEHTQALRYSYHVLAHYRAAGHVVGQARAYNSIGWCHGALGDYQRALRWCQRALPIQQEHDDIQGAAYTLDSLAYLHRKIGDHHLAITFYREAHALYRSGGEPGGEAEVLTGIGDIHYDTGNLDAARAAWQQALEILRTLNHPDAAHLEHKLKVVEGTDA
jgi:DNA-binding SARP family transcriptional activator